MKKGRTLLLQEKMMLVFVWVFFIILIMNLSMMSLLRGMNRRIDKVYTENLDLNKLDAALSSLETNLKTYVSTKSSDAMEG